MPFRNGEIKAGAAVLPHPEQSKTCSRDLDLRSTDSLGQNLVNALVKQLQGEMEFNKENGTRFKVTFRRS